MVYYAKYKCKNLQFISISSDYIFIQETNVKNISVKILIEDR